MKTPNHAVQPSKANKLFVDIPQVLIINLRAQLADNIRSICESHKVRAALLETEKAEIWLRRNKPKAIILSGSKNSVFDTDAPRLPEAVLKSGVPVLGLCYGFQALMYNLGGEVASLSEHRGYGRENILCSPDDPLFHGLKSMQLVWQSHGQSVLKLAPGFRKIAWRGTSIQGVSNRRRKVWGLQFHPEARHTRNGRAIIGNFLFRIAGCAQDWKPTDIIAQVRQEVDDAIKDGKIFLAFSGGVDSSALAAALHPVFGARLILCTIDGGQLRKGELQEIRENAHIAAPHCPHIVIRAAVRFQKALRGIVHPERKRKRFSRLYGRILTAAAKRCGAKVVAQATLAPDRIESGATGGALVVTHHNLFATFGRLQAIHPFRTLFKHEVRVIARRLGLPKRIYHRQPSPGPCLFIRIIGGPPTQKLLRLVRFADAEVTAILKKHHWYERISQLVVAVPHLWICGQQGDDRAMGRQVLVRAVRTKDYMTAEGVRLPKQIWEEIKTALLRHPDIICPVQDDNDKPKRRIEFE